MENKIGQTSGIWPSDIHVLIPSYRACASLKTMLPRLCAIVPAENICIADDGSHDGTEAVCKEHAVSYVSNLINKGKGAMLSKAFLWLIAEKKAAWIITMDADGQHALSDLNGFLMKIRQSPDTALIIGKRDLRPGKMPPSRVFSNTMTSLFLSLLAGRRIPDSQCGFRAYSAKLLASVDCIFPRFEMESEIILRACDRQFSIDFIPVQTVYFSTRTSHISLFSDTLRWLRAVIFVWMELRRNRRVSCMT